MLFRASCFNFAPLRELFSRKDAKEERLKARRKTLKQLPGVDALV
jgi:hypothetical protein